MGCRQYTPLVYNKKEDSLEHINETCSYINANIESFQTQLEQVKGKTIIEEIIKILSENPQYEGLGYRKQITEKQWENQFTFFKFWQIKKYSEKLGSYIRKNNLCPLKNFEEEGSFQFIGLFAKNCFEWAITDLACQISDITTVTFYATLGETAFQHIAEETLIETLCISPENVKVFLQHKKKFDIKNIKNIVLFNFTLLNNTENITALQNEGLNVILISDILNAKEIENETYDYCNMAKAESLLTICYTSGTTGIPKGVKTTQNAFYAEVKCLSNKDTLEYSQKETILIYLPLAHNMERVHIFACLLFGCRTGFLSGDVRVTLSDDIRILRPTFFVAVPRILQIFRQKILDSLENLPAGCKKNLIMKALRTKRENYQATGNYKHALYDKLVFSKISEKFGGKIKAFVSGSAPLSAEVANDIKILFSAPILEGYGLTESSGAASISFVNDNSNENVGAVNVNAKIKLVDVPEMKYHSKTHLNGEISPTGEICISGPIMFSGYFRNKKQTDECIDTDGWFHTGDIGRILPGNKGLKIIDRKKEIFKLNQGEYIAPSKLESVYMKSRYVSSICVYGNSLKTYIVAVIIPNREHILEFLKSKGKIEDNSSNIEKFFNDDYLLNEIKSDFDLLAKHANFNSLEKIVKFHISEKEFTIQNGCFTPTLKLARNIIANTFEKEIDALYV